MISAHDSFHHGEVFLLFIPQLVVVLSCHGIEVSTVGCVGEEPGLSSGSFTLFLIQGEAFQQSGFFVINKVIKTIDPLNGKIQNILDNSCYTDKNSIPRKEAEPLSHRDSLHNSSG